ncbi:MAG: beta-lactamase family protein [Candidatus Omnitrophica bacterium]|nr:beta-lactamase family protein [Candidatus Omnitrophota bacterium]
MNTIENTQESIEKLFRNTVQKDRKIHNAYLLVHSDKLGIHLNIAEGSTNNIPANENQPYYIASVGKLFTSVLVGVLVEQGKLSYEDTIISYLEKDLLQDLHIVKGKDYTNQIRIRHLLNHTSGIHDYFGDKPKHTTPMLELIVSEPSHFWTPQEVIQWSKEHLNSHFPPGKGFHYSDTGYHILGLIIEKTTSMPFHAALKQHIFQPLKMDHSYLAQYSEPIVKSDYPVANIYVDDSKIDVTQHRSLSIDYAGGGIVSTSDDLLTFMKALAKHVIISENIFEKMKDWARFFPGIDYGYGIMNIKTIPLFMPKKYNSWGNAGSTGSFLFYHPEMDAYLIGSLNHQGYHVKGIRMMLKIINILSKCD